MRLLGWLLIEEISRHDSFSARYCAKKDVKAGNERSMLALLRRGLCRTVKYVSGTKDSATYARSDTFVA
jgi:hypothetical protein